MKIKTFQGRTMAEALAAVKRQYGRHAVILSTRSKPRGGLFGMGVTPCVEITAARDLTDLPSPLRSAVLPALQQSDRAADRAQTRATGLALQVSDRNASDVLVRDVAALKTMVSDLLRETRRNAGPEILDELHSAYRELVESAVAEDIAEGLVAAVRSSLSEGELNDQGRVREALAQAMSRMVPTAAPILPGGGESPRLIALIGPTGVGKTTTVAKLAANLALRENRKVGLITIDTYRIAAIDQLRTYAQIINVPLAVATAPQRLREIVATMADRDVVLIDTAGRSQRDAAKNRELRAFFEAVPPDETHLVLSTTCSEAVLSETIDHFGPLGVDRVIFTKLDEAVGFGVMLKCLQKANARLSYVTTGQDVPDHIEVGTPERVVQWVIGGSRATGRLVAAS